jgi:hypothetical protein
MTISNVELTSVEGKRFVKRDEPIHQLNINSNSSITQVTPLDEGQADVEFRYTVNYIGVGFIKIEGRMLFKGDANNLAADWSAKRNMPDDVAQEIHGAIMGVCIPESVIVARDLNLTMPIPLPKIDLKKFKSKQGEEGPGMEVA